MHSHYGQKKSVQNGQIGPSTTLELPKGLAVVSSSRLSCGKAGKAQTFTSVRGAIWRIPVKPTPRHRERWRRRCACSRGRPAVGRVVKGEARRTNRSLNGLLVRRSQD